ncbi:hypothetical protein E4U40_000888, partial [Claviceps sp. LM458 group G5]
MDELVGKYAAIEVGTSYSDRSELDILSRMSQSVVRGSIRDDKTSLIPALSMEELYVRDGQPQKEQI